MRGTLWVAVGAESVGNPRAPGCALRRAWVAGCLGLLGAILLGSQPAEANRRDGLWGGQGAWPLIPIHMLLLPEGRVLTYGSNPDGTQTGRFWYDVWDPSLGNPASGHLTLRNTTPTDLFCSAHLVLPGSNDALLLGGDNWISSTRSTNNRGNNNSLIFRNQATPTLTSAAKMKRARWYATATTLPNGETYIQGGKDGTDRAEIRSASGSFRMLGFDSSALTYWYPRNFVTPSGRVFGVSNQSMYYVDPAGAGKLTMAGNTSAASPSGVTTTDVMYDVGKILRTGGGSQSSTGFAEGKAAAIIIDTNGNAPRVRSTAANARQAPLAHRHRSAGWSRGGHGRQSAAEPAQRRELSGLDLGSADREMDDRRRHSNHIRLRPALSLQRPAPARRHHPGWWRWRAGACGQHQRPDLLSALSVYGVGAVRISSLHHPRADPAELWPDLRSAGRPAAGDRTGDPDKNRRGHSRLQHGGPLPGVELPARRQHAQVQAPANANLAPLVVT